MLNNYQYFIALVEEMNISKAAKRLYISHQCLSKYLKSLEERYGIALFERSPRLTLTPAGQAYLDMLRQVEFLEKNLNSQLEDIRKMKSGNIRFGTTEGRYRVLIPRLLSEYNSLYPNVKLSTISDTSSNLCDRVAKNEIDMALLNSRNVNFKRFKVLPVVKENLFMVISDELLAQYFPSSYPACKDTFKKGIDLSKCSDIPFVVNNRGVNSRELLDTFLTSQGLHLNYVMEIPQADLHFMLAAKCEVACVCWAMHVPFIQVCNRGNFGMHLNVFPIKGLKETNQVDLIMQKGKILPVYGQDLVKLVKQIYSGSSSALE